MELTAARAAEIRLPERLDLAALVGLKTEVSALGDARVVIMRGANQSTFCRGLSLDEFTSVDQVGADDGLTAFEAVAMTLATSSTRSIARVDGDALGGGLGIAAACDVVIASEQARFGLPEPLFGLIPGLVLPLIRSRIGGPALRRLALGGESIDAREAWHLGLVDEVVAADQLDTRMKDWVRRLARAEPSATARLKRWLAEMDDLEREFVRGRRHLTQLLGSDVVGRRIARFARGLAPWQEDDGTL